MADSFWVIGSLRYPTSGAGRAKGGCIDCRKGIAGLVAGVMFIACEAVAGVDAGSGIRLQPGDGDRWRVTYVHPEGIDGLRFSRPAFFLREQMWQLETPGYALQREGGDQVVVLHDGQVPSRELAFSMAVDTRFIPREYEFFNTFTDGAVAIFLGAFLAETLSGDARYNRFELTPPTGRHVVIEGRRVDGPAIWVDEAMQGTYAYVGSQVPVQGRSSSAIVDAGLPGWLGSSAQSRVDRVVEAFTDRLGPSSARRPFVLVSHDPAAGDGHAFNGGTRDDLVQLRLQGAGWQTPSPEAERRLMRFFAHEVAHLWNAQRVRPADGEPPWLHEGSADALADRVLEGIGVIDAEEVRRGLERALNQCHGALRGGVVLDQAGNHRAHYDCGHVVSHWIGLEARAAGHGEGLFAFWAELIGQQADRPDGYTRADYFSVLASMGVGDGVLAAMQRFVGSPLENPAGDIAAAWAGHGLVVERYDAAAPEAARVDAAAAIVMALLQADCGAEYGFFTQGAQLELGGLGACGTARDGFVVTHLDGVPLDAALFAASHHARSRCREGPTLMLAGPAGSIELTCPGQLPEPPGWWRIRD